MAAKTILQDSHMLCKSVSRRGLLRWTVGGSAALAGVILGKRVPADVAESGQEDTMLTIEVAPDLSTFDTVRDVAEGDVVPTGPFYIQGPIFPEGTLDAEGDPGGATPIGTFRCWGWQFDGSEFPPVGVVSQTYEIDDRGEIQVQGLEDGSRAVTGGTGEFGNVRGEGNFEFINPDNLSFRATFRFWQQVLVPLVLRNYAGQQ